MLTIMNLKKWLKLAAKQHYKNAERLLAGLSTH